MRFFDLYGCDKKIPIQEVKFSFFEKAIKLEKNLPLVLMLLSKGQIKWDIFSSFVAFSQCFTLKINNIRVPFKCFLFISSS